MDLILWRHAEAEDNHGGDDRERELTVKGKKQAQKMAEWLNARLPDEARILVSPATRTVQTAQALERKFELSESIGLDAAASDLLAASAWPSSKQTVVLVGHQPTLGQLAALLVSGSPQSWEIKKGALWWLRSAPEDGGSRAALRVAMLPGMLE